MHLPSLGGGRIREGFLEDLDPNLCPDAQSELGEGGGKQGARERKGGYGGDIGHCPAVNVNRTLNLFSVSGELPLF